MDQRDFMALRKTRLCKARSHATDTVCAACSLIRKNGKELFKVRGTPMHSSEQTVGLKEEAQSAFTPPVPAPL